MTAEERRRLSLAIASRKESSDAYLLSTLANDPAVQLVVKTGLETFFKVLFEYWIHSATRHSDAVINRTPPDATNEPMDLAASQTILAVEPEITELTKEVNNSSVTAIVMSTGKQVSGKSLVINVDFRKRWEDHIKLSQARGDISLQGRVIGMNIKNFSAELDTGDGMKALLLFGEEQFYKFKLPWDRESQYRFTGRRTGKVSRKKNTHGKVMVKSFELIRN